jgi:enoyl-[acyl-carrier protein] reductase I
MRREAEIGQPAPEAAEAEAGAARLPSASMAGKRGLIMGVANDRSIAWGLAKSLHDHGAELAFTYQGAAFGSRVRPLAESVGSELVLPCDVAQEGEIAAVFDQLGQSWDGLDFVVHALAFSDKEELKGRYLDTSRANFARTLEISCFSFTEIARRAAPLMGAGGSLLTLTYLGAERVTPNYNVMGVAKAALEASVRYLAVDLGDRGIRVNAISAGPMRTLAGAAIADARFVYRWSRDHAPLARNVLLEEVGNAGLYLLSELARGVTGEIHHVDAGYNTIGIPSPSRLKRDE